MKLEKRSGFREKKIPLSSSKKLLTSQISDKSELRLPKIYEKYRKMDYNKQLNPYIKKLSTNDLIKLREENLASLKKKKFYVNIESEALLNQKNTKFYYNDLTPNRNLNGFNLNNFLSKRKLKNYCEKFILHDRSSYIYNDEKSFRNYKKVVSTSLKEEIE